MSEGRRYSDAFVALINEKTSLVIRARLIILSGGISLLQGGTEAPASDWVETIQIAQQSGEKRTLGIALLFGGAWALANNRLVQAAQYFEECRPMFHESGDEWSEALAVLWLSNTLSLRDEAERAKELFDSSLALARHQGDPWLLAVPLADMAQDALSRGSLEEAESTLLEVESVLRTVGDPWHLGWPLTALAQIRLSRGELFAARPYVAEALELGREYGNMTSQMFSLVETASIVTLLYGGQGTDPDLRESEFTNAARLCGATSPFVDSRMLISTLGTRNSYDALITQVRSILEPRIWERGFREGASMPLEQALELAASELRQAVS